MYDSMKQLTILVSALLISMSSMAQMYLWQDGQPTSANLDSITFTNNGKADDAFTIVENTLSVYEGATYTLTLEDNLYPANQYRWASGNTRVATVDENGTITAKQQGMTLITATYGRRTQMCILTVLSLEGNVQIKPMTMILYVGDSGDILVHFMSDAISPTITWKSLDPTIAQVDTTGKVTAQKEGKTKVIVEYGKRADTCQVIVSNFSVQLNITDIKQKKCTVVATPSDEEGYYYCGYMDKATMDGTTDDKLKETILTTLQEKVQEYNNAGYNIMAQLLFQGTKTLTANGLKASTDYVMFAFGIDVEREIAGSVVTRVPFRTADVVPSNMTFYIRCDSVRSTISASGKETIKSWFSINPSTSSETYLLAGGKKESVEQYGDAMAYLQYMEQYYDKQYASKGGVDAVLRTGNNPVYLSPAADGDEFIIAVAGYNGGFTTKAYSLVYKYEAAKDGKPARLVRKEVAEDSAMELNIIPMMLEEEMPAKEGNGQVLPLPIGMMHL